MTPYTQGCLRSINNEDHVGRVVVLLTTLSLIIQLLTYGRRVPLAELFARIDAVDAECVKRVAARFIYDKVGRSFSTFKRALAHCMWGFLEALAVSY